MATFLAVVIGVVLRAGSVGLAMRNRRDERVAIDRALTSKVSDEAGQLEEYFARARTINLITAHYPAFRDFYAAPGSRLAKVKANGPAIRRAESALAYRERLYPASIGEACFIDRSGPENARYVRGVRATFADLSPDESGNPFFAPTFALRAGEVFQAKPSVSARRSACLATVASHSSSAARASPTRPGSAVIRLPTGGYGRRRTTRTTGTSSRSTLGPRAHWSGAPAWRPSGWPSQRSRSFCSERSRFAAPAVPRGKASWRARPRRDGSRTSAATTRPSASSRRSCRSPATRTRHTAFSNGTCSGRSRAATSSCSTGTTATTGSRQ